MIGMKLVTPQTGQEGRIVRRLLIEEGLDIERELYLSVVVDRAWPRRCLWPALPVEWRSKKLRRTGRKRFFAKRSIRPPACKHIKRANWRLVWGFRGDGYGGRAIFPGGV